MKFPIKPLGIRTKFLFTICSLFLTYTSLVSQELRIGANFEILGEINGAFIGPSIGFEAPVSSHVSILADLASGYQNNKNIYLVKPALHVYFKSINKGLFIGPMVKFQRVNLMKIDINEIENLFAVGFSVGCKAQLREKLNLQLIANPHKTLGGSGIHDVAGVSVQLLLGISL